MAKRPRDPNQLAKAIVDIATGEATDDVSAKQRLTSRRGQHGGLVGGKVRAAKLSSTRRKEIAKLAAQARWSDKTR